MKKSVLIWMLLGMVFPVSMVAQDDLYFTPKKKTAVKQTVVVEPEDAPAYYAGSNRDIDEYNRRGKFRSSFEKIGTDSLGNDIIEFHVGSGVYPDSIAVDSAFVFNDYNAIAQDYSVYDDMSDDDSYTYTRRMSRWDDFYDPWFFGYYGYRPYWYPYHGWSSYYGWYSPWYTGWYGWYDPWYYGWYDPWFYGYGWGYPYYGYWGGWYGYGGYAHYGSHHYASGTHNHGRPSYSNASYGTRTSQSVAYSNGRFGGSRNTPSGNRASNTGISTVNRRSASSGVYSNQNGNFGGSRSSGSSSSSSRSSSPSYSAPARSSSSSSSSSSGFGGGGSFGGSRSGGSMGSSGGGSRSGGGGGFGGRR